MMLPELNLSLDRSYDELVERIDELHLVAQELEKASPLFKDAADFVARKGWLLSNVLEERAIAERQNRLHAWHQDPGLVNQP